MKAVLSCDDVFDVLTRAPFPSGTSDDEVVESHLAVCHDCRQLAEALRPAVGLFHEALHDDADDALPTYRGELSFIDRCMDREGTGIGIQRPPATAVMTGRKAATQAWLWSAACLVVLVVMFATVASRSRLADGETTIASTSRLTGDRDVVLLTALDLPIDCTTNVEAKLAETGFDCCTKCHTADSPVSSSSRAILKSSAACIACHDWIAERVSKSLSFIFTHRPGTPSRKPPIAVAKVVTSTAREDALRKNAESQTIVAVNLAHSSGTSSRSAATTLVVRNFARAAGPSQFPAALAVQGCQPPVATHLFQRQFHGLVPGVRSRPGWRLAPGQPIACSRAGVSASRVTSHLC